MVDDSGIWLHGEIIQVCDRMLLVPNDIYINRHTYIGMHIHHLRDS